MCQDLDKSADQEMFVTFILKRGLCSQTDIPFGFPSDLRVFVASVTLGRRFELRSSHQHLVSVHKWRSNTESYNAARVHTRIFVWYFLSFLRVLVVAVWNFRPTI